MDEQDYQRTYAYAVRNGFHGSFADYMRIQYEGYASICSRNGVLPLSRAQWELGLSRGPGWNWS